MRSVQIVEYIVSLENHHSLHPQHPHTIMTSLYSWLYSVYSVVQRTSGSVQTRDTGVAHL